VVERDRGIHTMTSDDETSIGGILTELGTCLLTESRETRIRNILTKLGIEIRDYTLEQAALRFGNTGDLKTHQEIARELRAMKGMGTTKSGESAS
jgi:hypothetical protein